MTCLLDLDWAISTIWDSGTWCFINNDKKEILAIVWDYVSIGFKFIANCEDIAGNGSVIKVLYDEVLYDVLHIITAGIVWGYLAN